MTSLRPRWPRRLFLTTGGGSGKCCWLSSMSSTGVMNCTLGLWSLALSSCSGSVSPSLWEPSSLPLPSASEGEEAEALREPSTWNQKPIFFKKPPVRTWKESAS